MVERMAIALPPIRAEREITLDTMAAVGDVARPLTWFERISNITLVRRLVGAGAARRRLGIIRALHREPAAVSESVRHARSVPGRRSCAGR